MTATQDSEEIVIQYSPNFTDSESEQSGSSGCGSVGYEFDEEYSFLNVTGDNTEFSIVFNPVSPRDDEYIGSTTITLQIYLSDYEDGQAMLQYDFKVTILETDSSGLGFVRPIIF